MTAVSPLLARVVGAHTSAPSPYARVEAPPIARQWPFRLGPFLFGRRSDLRTTQAQLDSFQHYAQVGDPVADALVAAMKGPGSAALRRQFEQALVEGIDAVENAPVPLREFFETVENVPYWVDFDSLDRAADLIGLLAPTIPSAIMVGLTLTYSTPDGNAVLLRAGDTRTKAARRLVETASWYAEVTDRDGMCRGAKGFQSTVRIRMTHAFLRAGMRHRADWDTQVQGYPVHQQVYASVIVAFSVYPTIAALMMGKWFTRRDRDDIMQLWRYIGHVAGVHPSLIPAGERDAVRLAWMFFHTVLRPDHTTTELGTAMVDAIPEIFGVTGDDRQATRWFLRTAHSAIARLTLGSSLSDQLGYGRFHPAMVPVVAATVTIVGTISVLDRIPPLRRAHLALTRRWGATVMERMSARTHADLSYARE